jgi:integrase
MARGSIVWRCGTCGNLSKPCEHPGGKYAITYPIQRWDPAVGKIVKGQKWETVPLGKSGRPNKKQAETLLAKRLTTVHDGSYRELQEITFADFADKWLAEYAMVSVKRSTFEAYESHIRFHFKPAFGALSLRAITESMIQGYLATKSKSGAAPKSVKNHLVTLKLMLRHAIRWSHLAVNPAAEVTAPRSERREMEILTPAEVRHLLTARTKKGEPAIRPGWYVPIKLAIFSGLRQGEQFALRVSDLDFHGGQVRVRRSLRWDSKRTQADAPRYHFNEPKSKAGIRNVDLAPDLLDDLRRYVAGLPGDDPERLLFPSAAGTPLDPKNVVNRIFKIALAGAGLASIRWHDMRHTYASLQLAAGANIKYLSQQMGHASVAITLDRYSHLLKDGNREQAGRLSSLVFEGAGTDPLVKTKGTQGVTLANGSLTEQERTDHKTIQDGVKRDGKEVAEVLKNVEN